MVKPFAEGIHAANAASAAEPSQSVMFFIIAWLSTRPLVIAHSVSSRLQRIAVIAGIQVVLVFLTSL